MDRVLGLRVSPNTIERICLQIGNDLELAAESQWKDILNGEVPVPQVAIVGYDGGRIRTRQTGHGPGVHLAGKGWNETKNAIFVSAKSETSEADPEPEPPKCFLNPEHVAQLAEKAKIQENTGVDDSLPEDDEEENPAGHT